MLQFMEIVCKAASVDEVLSVLKNKVQKMTPNQSKRRE